MDCPLLQSIFVADIVSGAVSLAVLVPWVMCEVWLTVRKRAQVTPMSWTDVRYDTGLGVEAVGPIVATLSAETIAAAGPIGRANSRPYAGCAL